MPAAGRGGRSPIPVDPVYAQLADGSWKAPAAGDVLRAANGQELRWEKVPLKDGSINHRALGGGYAFVRVTSDRDQAMLLEAAGAMTTLVNGLPRGGDLYSHGYVTLPIALKKGDNDLLFLVGRGSLRVKFVEPKGPQQFHPADMTTPDLVQGEAGEYLLGVPVLNSTEATVGDLIVEATVAGGEPVRTAVPALLPHSLRKVGLAVRASGREANGPVTVHFKLLRGPASIDTAKFDLAVKKPPETRKVTFRSQIDGSVQYYGWVPAKPDGDKKPGLVLTLHGAGVEAIGQAACFTPKAGLHVVAATNRRPFGFDWEDWGRWDALEVLDHASKALGTDPARTYLTGHSMGGHGTWHLGVTFPARFAAIGPSAGWVSMWSYAGMKRAKEPGQIEDLILRAANPSDTLALARNYNMHGIYVLHGDADDNVPVGQARTMRTELAKFHRDFAYYEQPGAGHWWGNPCVDWGPMFQYFEAHRVPAPKDVHDIDFATASPGVSADCHWLRVEAQTHALRVSTVRGRRNTPGRSFDVATDNVARLSLDVSDLPVGDLTIKVDGQSLKSVPRPPSGQRLVLARTKDAWGVATPALPTDKRPERWGPFREAFRNRMVFVYGTGGTAEENAWALAKARFDAEQFWYRGNGSIDVVADREFEPKAYADRNVIVYGHSDMNVAWKSLLSNSPIQVRRGQLTVGDRADKGADLGAVFVRPRADSSSALVGVIAGTGLAGLRQTDRLPYFVSGVGYPDWMILGDTLRTGMAGVRGAGYFGHGWDLETGEAGWRK